MNIFGDLRCQRAFHYICHGWPMCEPLSRVNADHQLDASTMFACRLTPLSTSLPICKKLDRFLNPIRHAARKDVSSQCKAVTEDISRQQNNETLIIKFQFLAKILTALDLHILPLADRLTKCAPAHSCGFKRF